MSDRNEIISNLSNVYDALETLSESISEYVDEGFEDEDEVGEVLLSLNKADGSVVEMYTINDEFMATINIEFLDDLLGYENSKYIKEELNQGNTVDIYINPEIIS